MASFRLLWLYRAPGVLKSFRARNTYWICVATNKSFSWYHFQLFLWPLNWCKCRIAFLSLIHFVTKLDDYWLWIAWKLVNSLLQKAPINFYLMANNTGHNLRVKFGENWNCLLAVFLATRLSVACLYISLVAGVEHCLMRKKKENWQTHRASCYGRSIVTVLLRQATKKDGKI